MIKNYKILIPNAFTSFSLISGLFALHFVYEEKFVVASWLIALAMIFDGLDGKLARLLNVSSKFGELFDTLSDFFAFGVVPAFLAYKVSLYNFDVFGIIFSIFYVFSGGYRLVRFTLENKDIESKQPFTGLPIPAAAGLIVSFVIFNFYIWNTIQFPHVFLVVIFIASVLMVSKIEYLPIDRKNKLSKESKFFIVLALISIIISIKFSYIVFAIWILIYILYGIIRQIFLLK